MAAPLADEVQRTPDADSMPRASTSTLSKPAASRSSLSHSMTVRSGMEAFSTGTMRHSKSRVSTNPPVCCDKCRKPDQLARERDELAHGQAVRRQAEFFEPLHAHGLPSNHCWPLAMASTVSRSAQRFAHIADGRAGPVADDGSGEGCAVAPVFGVQVLDDLFAALVLEVDVDVRRLIALWR